MWKGYQWGGGLMGKTYDEHFQDGLDEYETWIFDEDDERDGYTIMMEQLEYAENYADTHYVEGEEDDDDGDDDDADEEGPGGQGLAWQSNEEWFDTLGTFHS